MYHIRLALIAVLVALAAPAFGYWQSRDSNYNAAIVTSGGGYSGPGDVVSGASVFYGLRAYNAAYATANGKLITMDNIVTGHSCDILAAATGGVGLTANCGTGGENGETLATWCASTCATGNNHISVVYDQSGNSIDANVVTTAPVLMLNCLNTSLPCIQPAAAANTGLTSTATVSLSQPFTVSVVAERTGNTAAFNTVIGCNAANVQTGFSNSANTALLYAGTVVSVGSVADSVLHSMQAVYNGATSSLNADGVTTSSLSPGAAACSGAMIFAAGASSMTGVIGEAGVYPSALSGTQQTNLCHNQRLYWGSTGSC